MILSDFDFKFLKGIGTFELYFCTLMEYFKNFGNFLENCKA